MTERYVLSTWRCEKCRKAGEWRLYVRPRETDAGAVHRYVRETRNSRCVPGCLFTAVLAEPREDA